MKRLLVSSLALGLLWMPACEGGGSDDTSSASSNGDNTAGDSGTETGIEVQPCGTEWAEKDGTTPSIMDEWGAPCMSDADCVPILGDGSKCVNNILEVYDLPGGYCTKDCELPDSGTTFEYDHATCSVDGGVTCIGANGFFTACVIECENDSQCGREGYACRTMPTIAAEGDPKFCLMNVYDCCAGDLSGCGP